MPPLRLNAVTGTSVVSAMNAKLVGKRMKRMTMPPAGA
jgi:hypothetical protein